MLEEISHMASTLPHCDSPTPFAHEVMQLYAEALPDVRFPDLDLASLQATAEQVQAAQVAVERAAAELDRARTLLHQQAALMHARAERALAYAQVFAAGNAELAARVAQVAQLNAAQSIRPTSSESAQAERRPRRKRRAKADPDDNLFGVDDGGPSEAFAS